jgi:hypothetical protein
LRQDERHEDLYQRLLAFINNNLLKREKTCGITHQGLNVNEDEEMSLTVKNLIVLTWLRLIKPSLPQRVKQRYGTEPRVRTLASIKLEISQAPLHSWRKFAATRMPGHFAPSLRLGKISVNHIARDYI